MARTRERLKLRHHFRPRGGCAQLFKRRDDEVLLSGPAGTGKSRACLEKLHVVAVLNPGMRGLITRKTQSSLASTALDTWRKFVVKEAMANGDVEYYGGSAQYPPHYRYKNGSEILIGGLDKPIKIMSSEYDMIYIQEATELRKNDWELVTTRLRNGVVSFQQLIGDCNPGAPTHWLKKRADKGDTVLLETRHEDNPRLFDENGDVTQYGKEYLEKLDKLTGVRYLRLRKGLWVAAEGMIYEEFDPALHVIEKADIPEDWTRYWSVDFGFTNAFVCQWWAEDPDGALIMYREMYKSQTLVRDHAKAMLDQVVECVTCCGNRHDDHICHTCFECVTKWTEPQPQSIICDHDAEGRAQLEKYLGLSTVAAIKEVSNGIQCVQERLKVQKDGYARIYFMEDSLVERDPELDRNHKPQSLLEEIIGYVWAQTKDGDAKEEPLKEDDHAMDAMRYVVAEKDLGARPRVRMLDY
ncbi:MAG: phage terminase large subunit [Candidatus Binatia bacterium]